jgi:hypothetical protein
MRGLSLCLLCCFETEGPACCDGATSTPGSRDPAALCVFAQGAAFFGGGKSRRAFSGGGGARLAHTKQARRATRTAGAASCVAALVGLGRAAFRRSFSSLIAHRGPICVVLITAHWGLSPLIRGRGRGLQPTKSDQNTHQRPPEAHRSSPTCHGSHQARRGPPGGAGLCPSSELPPP